MSSFCLRLSLILIAVVASTLALENATNASSFHGNSQFLQMLFDKYGKDGIISYEAFERLMSKVGIAVVPQTGDTEMKSNGSQHEQGALPRPGHDHDHHNHVSDGASSARSNPSGDHSRLLTPKTPAAESKTGAEDDHAHTEERGKRSVRGHGNMRDSTRNERAVGGGDHTPQGRQVSGSTLCLGRQLYRWQ